MSFLAHVLVIFFVTSQMPELGECSGKQVNFRLNKSKYLANHVIETRQAETELECGVHCVSHGSCESVNYKTSGIGKGLCELNNEAMEEIADYDDNPDFSHLYIIKTEPQRNDHEKTKTMSEEPLSSCTELLEKNRSLASGTYTLKSNITRQKYEVYCHMAEISACGSGGWTLVMKVDGKESTFNYDSLYWTNNDTYEVENGLEGLTEKQTKLASYSNTAFNKICLGMKVNGNTKWIVIDHQASSLFDVIANVTAFTRTNVSMSSWKSLINGSLLQQGCFIEGFNINGGRNDRKMYVRVGLVADNGGDCSSCNSFIGFGASVTGCDGKAKRNACGHVYACGKYVNIAAFGYILVQ